MWIFTTDGYISAVAHQTDESLLRVRARVREDLVRAFPDLEEDILDLRGSGTDYRWHLNVPRDRVKAYLASAVDGLDYTSHAKDYMTHGLGPQGRLDAMYAIWDAMYKLQSKD